MRPIRLALVVEDLDEVRLIRLKLLLRYTLSNQARVLVNANNRVVLRELARELVAARFVYTDLAALGFVRNVGFLDQGMDEILDGAALADEEVVLILVRVISNLS